MLEFLYIFWCGAWNFIRGRGYSDKALKNPDLKLKLDNIIWSKCYWILLSKAPCYAYIVLPIWLFINWQASLVVFFGLMLPSIVGWGKAAQALKGEGNIDKVIEPEFKPIDWIVDKIYGEPVTKEEARGNATFWANIFGLLYFPMFLYLALTHNMLYVFSILPLMVMGHIISNFSEWKWFELTWGLILGTLIVVGI